MFNTRAGESYFNHLQEKPLEGFYFKYVCPPHQPMELTSASVSFFYAGIIS